MLPLLLKGPALTVLRSLNRAQQESPDEILNALVRRFEPDSLKQSKKVQLYALKMKKEESLEDFIEKLLSKAREIQLSDEDVLSIFLTNVATPIRKSIIMKQPKTLSQALNMARLKYSTIEACKGSEDSTIDDKLDKILSNVRSAPAERGNETNVNLMSEKQSEDSTIDENWIKFYQILELHQLNVQIKRKSIQSQNMTG